MCNILVKFCTAVLVSSIISITYQRWPNHHPEASWPNLITTVSAASSIKTIHPSVHLKAKGGYDLDPERSAKNLKESSKYGLPSGDNIRLFNDFILSYDRRLRAPVWVFEHLTPEKLHQQQYNVSRAKSKFKEDNTIHEYFRARLSDFSRSGYDRGHMAAAGNHKLFQEDLDQTFILSNISPQEPEFNRGGWERLETFVRWRAKRSKNLYVITGPLYLPIMAKNGNLYVTYRVIGGSLVSVPTHYYKVFLFETNDNRLMLEAFMMPNDNKLTDRIYLDDYRVDISQLDRIERVAGVIFFDQLDRGSVETPNKLPIEYKDGTKVSSREDLQCQLSVNDQ